MAALVLLLSLQSFGTSLSDELSGVPGLGELRSVDLPRLSEPELQERHPLQVRFSAELFAVYTGFQKNLRIEDAWGFGGDLKIIGDWGRRVCLVLRVGYAGWNTSTTNDSLAFPASAQVRQFRFGAGVDFVWRLFELGLSANSGVYQFQTRSVSTDFDSNETPGFFQLELTFGVKPAPFLKLGLVGMLTFTSTGFNLPETRNRTCVISSIGPAVELKFDF
jgi:hypothetical protein